MAMTRREWLRLAGAASALTALPFVSACSDDEGDGLPRYRYDGTPGPLTTFDLGVASGDPLVDAVVLWTHLAPGTSDPVDVWLEVATDEAFRHRIVAQSYVVDASTDFTFKIDVGSLEAGRTYFYRFQALGIESPIGRTRTVPTDSVSQLRLGVVTCANYGFGLFHAYARLGERDDLDAIVHLGDYIYEYENGYYPFPEQRVRDTVPENETITLDDYRARYRHYHGDADLQLAHRRHPWFVIWDDHEVADNAYTSGANGHQPNEGDYAVRLAAAKQAYFEYLPIRGMPADGIHRSVRYGDLVDLIFLDTRLEGRTVQIADLAADDDTRSMLGATQEAWLDQQLAASTTKWRVLAQQVVVAQFTYDSVDHLPVSYDQWDGYPRARARLFDSIEDSGHGNVVVLTGDLHGACAFELARDPWNEDSSAPQYDPATGANALAVELVTASITSPYNVFSPVTTEETQLTAACPHLKWTNLRQNGFLVLDVTSTRVQADFYVFEGGIGAGSDGTATWAKGVTIADGVSHLVDAAAPVMDVHVVPAD